MIDGMFVAFSFWFFDRDKGPVGFVVCTFLDPATDEFFVLAGELTEEIGRGHDVVWVIADDALPDE